MELAKRESYSEGSIAETNVYCGHSLVKWPCRGLPMVNGPRIAACVDYYPTPLLIIRAV